MKRFAFHVITLATALLASTVAMNAQVATGAPPFSTIEGGPFDGVNLGNLNVHFSVPILHKAGRGISFAFDLGYDNSVWTPVTSGGVTSWRPVLNWGWSGSISSGTGFVSFNETDTFPIPNCQKTTYSGYVYHDSLGATHPFNGSAVWEFGIGGHSCTGFFTGFTNTASDGSGYTLTISNFSGTGPLKSKSGTLITTPFNQTGGTTSGIVDANGNEVTANTSNQFFDTLSSTSAVLSTSGSGTPASPVNYQYTSPAGSKQYSAIYTAYTVQTNFGCTTQEYPPTSNNLVSEIDLPDGSKYLFSYETTPGDVHNPHYVTGRISTVTLPTGGSIQYSYTGANDGINCADASTLSFQRVVTPGGTWTYLRSGTGTDWTTTVTDPASNQTAISFEKDSATTPPTNNFYETQRQAYQGTTSGTLMNTTINCYNSNSVGTPTSCYNTPVSSPIRRVTTFKYLPNSQTSQASENETDSTYDTFGLINEVDEYDDGSNAVGNLIRKTITAYQGGMSNGIVDRPSSVTIEDSGNAIHSVTSYLYDEGTPATPGGTTPQHLTITGSRGNLTTVNAQANGTTHLYRKYAYYNTGMLSTSTDVSTSSTTNGATTTYNYNSTGNADCGNAFVTSISEPVGSMSRSFAWDCNGGVLLSVTDENGKTSSTAYSGTNFTNVFWRPYSTTDEAGTVTDYLYYLNTATPPIEFQTESKYHTAFNSGNSIVDKVTTADGFGRTIFSQTKQGPNTSNYDTVATCYDNFGRASFSSLPYSTTLATSSSTCPSSNNGISTSYDAIGRTYQVQDSGTGKTTYSYNANDTTETRTSPTISKQSEYDGLGRLKSVCEINGGTIAWPSASCSQNTTATGYLTTYGYDVLGNLTSMAQNNQASSGHQTRGYVYDMLGRLTSETNPETNNASVTYSYDFLSSDVNCGTITSAGNLLKRLDAAGNPACYAGYDALHRVGNVTYPSSSTPSRYFVYDTATVNGSSMSNAKTRLAEAYTCIGGCSSKTTDLGFSYGSTGQTSDVWELTPHSGSNYYFHVTATPWPNGAINILSNLVGLPTITYGADGEGRMSTVSASSGQFPVTSVSYNPASQVTGVTYGSSDTDSFTYFSTTGRMQTYTYSMGSAPKTDSGTLNWNSNGTLLSLTISDQINTANTQTCNYTHDALGRIASANCGSTIFNQNFSFDPFGNITKTVPTGSTGTAFGPTYDYTNYTNRMTSTPFTYNGNNGAVTADGSHGYAWDTENRLSTVDSGASNGVCITYDALDRVVEQATGATCNSSFKEIVYSPAGAKLALMNGSTLVNAFVFLPGGAQVVYNGAGLQFYRHPDWLGSSRLATTPSRTCYWDIAYAPFGENYVPPATGCVAQDLNFTDQNQDTESSVPSGGQGGLFDFMFRKHSPVQGRWLSPDPAGIAAANPSDPQTWNRYAYVANRPTNTIDLLGQLIGYCPPEYEDCGGGGGGGGCDPVFGCICLDCGGGGGGPTPPRPGPEPPSPVAPLRRVGGVWANNETLGLPGGLGMSPLDVDGLLSLIDPCASRSSVTFGLGIAINTGDVSGSQSNVPCVVIQFAIFVAAADKASKKGPSEKCEARISRGYPMGLDVCSDHGMTTVLGWTCEGGDNSVACCNAKEKDFETTCRNMNTWPGIIEFRFFDDSHAIGSRAAVCCRVK